MFYFTTLSVTIFTRTHKKKCGFFRISDYNKTNRIGRRNKTRVRAWNRILRKWRANEGDGGGLGIKPSKKKKNV